MISTIIYIVSRNYNVGMVQTRPLAASAAGAAAASFFFGLVTCKLFMR